MRDIPTVLVSALRLLWRHWPALLSLAFIGAGLRTGDLWLAAHLSKHHHHLPQLFLVLAPLACLVPVIGMFLVCRPSLPRLVELSDVTPRDMPSERRPERLVDVAASVLIPFLAVYEAYGLLDKDISTFRNAAAYSAFEVSGATRVDYSGRLGIYPVKVAVLVVVGAWLLRWGIGLVERSFALLALAYLGALTDVIYTAQLAGQTLVLRSQGLAWLEERKALHWVGSAYHWVRDGLGFLSGPFSDVVSFAQAVGASWTEIIVVPIAWLGVGAVILARQEADEEEDAEGDGTGETTPRRQPALLRAVLSLVADVRKRIGALWNALKLLASAGLMPMLAFCLVLLAVVRLPSLLSPLVRATVGPIETNTYLAYSPIQDSTELALSFALAVPLVAAAVEWLVLARLERHGLVADLDARTGTSTADDSSAAPIVDAPQEAAQGAGSST